MRELKKCLGIGALAIALNTGVLIVGTGTASADVACNRHGECWHVQERYTNYPHALGVHFYGDDWREAHRHDRHYHWLKDRDDDHGYYSHGRWHAF
jgi:hypothetical protein